MKEQDKKTIFSFLLELVKMIFSIGQKHVEKNVNDNVNVDANVNM